MISYPPPPLYRKSYILILWESKPSYYHTAISISYFLFQGLRSYCFLFSFFLDPCTPDSHQILESVEGRAENCHFNLDQVSPGGYTLKPCIQLYTTNVQIKSGIFRLTEFTPQHFEFTRRCSDYHRRHELDSKIRKQHALPLFQCLASSWYLKNTFH